MTPAAIALGIAIVACTIGVTAARYRRLPDTIAIHFGLDGKADGYGPRFVVWLMVALQCATAGFYALLFPAFRPGQLIAADCFLAIFLWGQLQLTQQAGNGSDRPPVVRNWTVAVALAVCAILAIALLR